MNTDYEKQLEQAIAEKLKALPELAAPDQLTTRVLSMLAARAALPWYRRPWQTWSPIAKTASLLLLLALFGALSSAGWNVSKANILPHLSEWISVATLVANTGKVLASAALVSLKQLGPNFLIGCAFLATLAYTTCIGVGTVIFRQAKKINL